MTEYRVHITETVDNLDHYGSRSSFRAYGRESAIAEAIKEVGRMSGKTYSPRVRNFYEEDPNGNIIYFHGPRGRGYNLPPFYIAVLVPQEAP